LNIQGVSDVNRNDLSAAAEAFRNAYSLDPNNVFAVNNLGFLSELEGDRETAEFFYEKAQAMGGVTVGLATRRSAEGSKLSQVASDSQQKVEAKVSQERGALRQQHEPILLRRRDNSIVPEPSTAPPSPAQQQ
jgi:Flp pilus assembly protein TadD